MDKVSLPIHHTYHSFDLISAFLGTARQAAHSQISDVTRKVFETFSKLLIAPLLENSSVRNIDFELGRPPSHVFDHAHYSGFINNRTEPILILLGSSPHIVFSSLLGLTSPPLAPNPVPPRAHSPLVAAVFVCAQAGKSSRRDRASKAFSSPVSSSNFAPPVFLILLKKRQSIMAMAGSAPSRQR